MIQARGMPIDMPLWNSVQENKAAVIGELLRRFDPSYGTEDPIYTPDGEWSYERFERWLASIGVHGLAAPRQRPARHRRRRLPADVHSSPVSRSSRAPRQPGRDRARQATDRPRRPQSAIAVPVRHRHRPQRARQESCTTPTPACGRSWFSRPARSASIWIGERKRSALPPPYPVTKRLMANYAGGDVYYDLARLCGLTDDPDQKHWKACNPDQRQRMKPLQLAINYGMGVPSLAKGLDRHPLIASEIIEHHRRTYPRFWEWRAEHGRARDARPHDRARCSVGRCASAIQPNKRTLYNFPMQSGGAEMLRLAAWRLCEAGIVPIMLVHDGILLEVQDQEQIDHAIEIMRAAGRDVCGGFEIGVDVDQKLEGGARYRDKRAVAQRDVEDDHGCAGSDRRRAEEDRRREQRSLRLSARQEIRDRDPRHRPANQKAAAPGGDVRASAAAVWVILDRKYVVELEHQGFQLSRPIDETLAGM